MQAPNYSVEKAWGLRVGAGDPGVYWSNMCQAMVFLNCLISGNFEQLQTERHPFHGYTVQWETELFFSQVVEIVDSITLHDFLLDFNGTGPPDSTCSIHETESQNEEETKDGSL